jgi:uncharacterized protein YndB with AHSA1/START domain
MTQKLSAIAVQTFNAPPQRVYDAIIDPEMIARSMFGPLLREEIILHIGNDARVGGAFSYKVKRGDDVIDHVGEFLELDPPHRISFTWGIAGQSDADPSVVIIDIAPTPDGCRLTLTHEIPAEWAAYVERSRAGWEKMLGVLASLL